MKGTIPDAASLNKPVSSEDEALASGTSSSTRRASDVPDAVIEEIEAAWLRRPSSACRRKHATSW